MLLGRVFSMPWASWGVSYIPTSMRGRPSFATIGCHWMRVTVLKVNGAQIVLEQEVS